MFYGNHSLTNQRSRNWKRFFRGSVHGVYKKLQPQKPLTINGCVQTVPAVQPLRSVQTASEAVAVGSLNFVETVKNELGFKAEHREVIAEAGTYALREQSEAYGSNFTSESEPLRFENARFWDENHESTAT
jgi:hypothetical protein